MTLYALQQAVLILGVQGSGDITAFGQVDLLVAEMAGSGDVDASELVAKSAKLSMVGSGDIDAYVSDSVKARVMGSGDIVIRGNHRSAIIGCRLRRHQVQEEVTLQPEVTVTERRQSIHFVPTIDQE